MAVGGGGVGGEVGIYRNFWEEEIGGRGGRCGVELGKPSVAPWRAVC